MPTEHVKVTEVPHELDISDSFILDMRQGR